MYEHKNEFDLALMDYSKAILIDQNLALAYYRRGHLYMKTLNYDGGLSDFNTLIQILLISPSIDVYLSRAYSSRGFLYLDRGENDKAIEDFSLAIEIDPGLEIGYSIRANAYHINSNFDNAISDYNSAIQILLKAPSYGVKLDNMYYIRGMVYWYGLNDRINARKSFQRARELGSTKAVEMLDEIR